MPDDAGKKSLLSRWKESDKSKSLSTKIPKAPADAVIPASHGQQRLWFLQQLYPKNQVYNYSELYTFKGKLDTELLKESLQIIFEANTVLRASFVLDNGNLIQKTDDNTRVKINEIDLSTVSDNEREKQKKKILMADASRHFDLDMPPLMRVCLLKLTASDWELMVTMHHIITDKWSMGLFREQLAANYKRLSGEISTSEVVSEIQFSDFAYWQQNREVDNDQLNYWKVKLAGDIPMLDLPVDHVFTGNSTFKGTTNRQQFSAELSRDILALSKSFETTPYVLLLAVYYLMLSRYSGQNDILVGTPISIRKGKTQESLIGFFDETIVLRTQISPDMTFKELVEEVKKTTLEAFSNKDIPFDLLVKELKPERALGRNPFFRTMFMYHDVPPKPTFGSEVQMDYNFLNSGVSKFDLTMYISNDNEQLSASFEYSLDHFKEETILRFQEHYKILVDTIVSQPGEKVGKIPMLSPAELQILLPTIQPSASGYENYSGIHQIIEAQGMLNPDSLAVVYSDEQITYRDLLHKSALIAGEILVHSKGKNKIIGLCFERSIDMIVGMLAILKAGCAYLPIDPEYPEDRIRYMLEDSETTVVLTQGALSPLFDTYSGSVLYAEENTTAVNDEQLKIHEVNSTDLAYVIYTSGSTGKPKGVPISHGNIICSTAGRLNFYPGSPSAFLLMSSISFDSSKAGIFWTLCTSGTLVIAEKHLEQDLEKLTAVISKNKVSHTLMLPSLYKTILDFGDITKLDSLKAVIVAGEACSSSVCKAHFSALPAVSLYNEYGPTEATVWCTAHHIKIEDLDKTAVPIGKAVANAEIYILNQGLQMVPIGAAGEIYIGGPGLSGSYLNKPSLTDAAYISHPFKKEGSLKLYKTGDKARMNKDGVISFLGRVDQQIKIRGFRIEPGEIEKIIETYPGVKKTVILIENKATEVAEIADHALEMNEISRYLRQLEGNEQLTALLSSIEQLEEDEKNYLLSQME